MKQQRQDSGNLSSNTWTCPNCEGSPTFEHKDMLEHLKTVHGVTDMNGRRPMVMHVDGSDFFMYQYEWIIDGKTYYQTTRDPRKPAWK